ncbi:alpha/beta fold hydrolase [Microlunatus soli]|uniref:Pimeloyl-ACP methyl ester carboxylesterase n=1 Tax=Microlunatus soli TaxID=630515 RepID=A0A1H1TTK3_9ACTN|nr:alpha/beta hydrolase [Microlunatus soli]SDS63421.1 Pimeloyl-ACP methyl ester carboxylesterase [Microlunatus soli]
MTDNGDPDTVDPRHPQGTPGRADITDGRELFYQELPGPTPTVVFEAGLASTRSIWGLTQPRLKGVARAVVYDRAGMGHSPRAAGPRRLTDLAADLNGLLDALTADPADDQGFVLVGHSLGGPIVRLAAAARPDRIAGIVLVDPADEDCDVYYAESTARIDRIQNTLFPPLARIGLLRRIYGLTVGAMPPTVRADLCREMYTPSAVATQIAESSTMTEGLRALQTDPADLADIPMTVISGGTNAGIGADARRKMITAHRARAARSVQGRHLVAEKSGHLVMMTEPELIVAEIERMLAARAAQQ